MSEVGTVVELIRKLIVVALALGVAGTLADSVIGVRDNAKRSIDRQQMSYVWWNQQLHKPNREK